MNESEKASLEKIKNLRNQKGLSQTKFVELIGSMSQTGYARIERGDAESIPLSLAVGIAKALNVGFNELFDIDGDSQKIGNLNNEIELLKKRIIELEDQLNDKRRIIEFLSSNDLLLDVAFSIEHKIRGGGYEKHDLYDIDSIIKGLKDRPFDRENRESIKNYILEHFDYLQTLNK